MADFTEDKPLLEAEEAISEALPAAEELLEELIEVRTENPPGSNYLECVLLLRERLAEMGLESQIVEVPAKELRDLGLPPNLPRPSIVASLGSPDPDAPILHFHGHYDVVPGESARMFHLHLEGDEAWGRGTADMKGGLVSMLLALKELRRLAPHLRGRVMLSIVPDEETGGQAGTGYLFKAGVLPQGSIGMLTPEPTGGEVWNGNRGAYSLMLTVHGKMAHVAVKHHGKNAFTGMVELAAMLEELRSQIEARHFAMEPPLDTPSSGAAPGSGSIVGTSNAGSAGTAGQPGEEDGEPDSVLLIGGICRGGTNFNVVPESVSFSIDRRYHPMEDGNEVLKELEAVFKRFRKAGWKLDVEWLQKGEASLTPPGSRLATALQKAVKLVEGSTPRFSLCPGVLETRFFVAHGTPGLAYGPGRLDLSHVPEERVSLQAILKVARVYLRTAWELVGPESR